MKRNYLCLNENERNVLVHHLTCDFNDCKLMARKSDTDEDYEFWLSQAITLNSVIEHLNELDYEDARTEK